MSVLNCFDIFTCSSHGSAEVVFVVANPVLQFYRLTSGKPRPGHIVLFQVPESHAHSGVELGLVLSTSKRIKAPKVFSGEASVKSIMAFRAVGLDMVDQENSCDWFCCATSAAWAVRLESLVAVSDCEECASAAFQISALFRRFRPRLLEIAILHKRFFLGKKNAKLPSL